MLHDVDSGEPHLRELGFQGADGAPSGNSCPLLPPELWQDIALHLHLCDLLTFGLVSKVCREATSMILRYPHVCGNRLVTVPNE
jgi:hypothetical protein